jgi:hypothetical protein
MKEFDENDVAMEHAKLVGGGGYLRLTHRPSGLSVDADLRSGPVISTMNALMSDLKQRVLAQLEECRGNSDRDTPGGMARGEPERTGGRDVGLEVDCESLRHPSHER